MTCNRFFNYNLVDQDSTEITVDSENAFFPVTNLKDYRTTKVFRSLDGATSATILFDMKTTETVDGVLVVADKLKGFGFASMVVEANATADFTSPAYSGTLTPDFQTGFGYLDLTETPQDFRFWRVTISGAAPYLELSKLFIGREIGLGRSINLNWSVENRDLSGSTTNRYGQKFVDKITVQQDLKIGFSNLTVEQNETIKSMFDYNGEHTPIWVILDPKNSFSSNAGFLAGQYFLNKVPQVNNPFYRRFDMNIRLLEAS